MDSASAAAAAHSLPVGDITDLRTLATVAQRSDQAGLAGLLNLTQDGYDFADPDNDTVTGGWPAYRRQPPKAPVAASGRI